MRSQKILGIILFVIIFCIGVYVYGRSRKEKNVFQQRPSLHVVTSFYPLYFFTKEIVKDQAEVVNFTPAGAEPHDYEPNTQDIAQVEKSNLLVVNGENFEPWFPKIEENLKGKNVGIVKAVEGLATDEGEQEGKRVRDPHIWLDPVLAKQEVKKIVQGIISVDSSHPSFYEQHASLLKEKLDALDKEFREGLKNCKKSDIITSHAAFGYVAKRYGFHQIPIAAISPDQEPSPRQLAEIATLAKEKDIHYIFVETLVSPRLAETLAREVGAKVLVGNPIEGLTQEEENKGVDYFSLQRENLSHFRIAMECQ